MTRAESFSPRSLTEQNCVMANNSDRHKDFLHSSLRIGTEHTPQIVEDSNPAY